MKTYINQFVLRILCIAAMALLVTSCKKTEDQSAGQTRLFKPGEVKVSAGESKAVITWTRPILTGSTAIQYTVDISTDSLFSTVKYTATVDTLGLIVTDQSLALRTKYFVRIKANATSTTPESKYAVSSSFKLTGVQLFEAIQTSELKTENVVLRFKATEGLTSITLTPKTGNVITIALTAADAAIGSKAIAGLVAATTYDAELFAGNSSMGFTSFTTKVARVFTVRLSPGDDLATAISSAANGAVIGLNPGVYDLSAAVTFITQKTITICSTSDVPADTKVKFKEFDLEGTGAGISFAGITFDGTEAAAVYFLNLIGSQAVITTPATFTDISVDNCIVHTTVTTFMRADRATNAADFKIGAITVNNSIVYDMGTGGAAYCTFHLNKLQFNTLKVSNSTFYNCGTGLVTANVTYTAANIPAVDISYSTFNNFGGNAKYALFDANANPATFTFKNNILANTPKSGSVLAAAIRATASSSSLSFTNNNYFNLLTATSGTVLTFSTASVSNNLTIDLGWNAASSTFTLPKESALRTASTAGGAIGDPRWTY